MDADPNASKELISQHALSISNDLYGNETMSEFELAKGFTKPVNSNKVREIPDDVIDVQLRLAARRKIALILKGKATIEIIVNVDDLIEVNNKNGTGNCGVWSTPKLYSLLIMKPAL